MAPQDVSFAIKAAESVIRGKDVEVVLTMKNTSDKPLSATIVVTSQVVRYTGVALKKLPKRREKKDLKPKKGTFSCFSHFFKNLKKEAFCLTEYCNSKCRRMKYTAL